MLASLSTLAAINKLTYKFNPTVNLSWASGLAADAAASSGNMGTDGSYLYYPTSLGTSINRIAISNASAGVFASSLTIAFSSCVAGTFLYVLDTGTGKIIQYNAGSTPPATPVVASWMTLVYPEQMTYDGTYLYIGNPVNGTVRRMTASVGTGTIDATWSPTAITTGMKSIVYGNGYIYACCSSNVIYKISTITAAVSTLITLASAPKSLAIYGGFLYIPVGTNIYLLNLSASELRTDYVSGLSSSSGCCCIANGYLYVMNTGSIAKIQCQ